jgi:membrane fusion protein (multidrug efflux system)
MMRPRSILPLLVAGLLACGGEEAASEKPAPPVSIAQVTVTDLLEEIEATGELIAPNHAKIAAEVGGRITAIVIEEGNPVEAGAIVLAIDPEARELDLKSARASMTEASAAHSEAVREAKRVRRLKKKNMASQAQFDSAETAQKRARSQAEGAEARLGVAERALREASVAAPFAGLVAQRFVSPGEYVQPGEPLFELVALDPIEVEFTLPEADSSRVALGNSVGVRVAPYPDEEFDATVTFVSPTIDPRTRTLRVKATIRNPEGRLRPGLFARADLGIAMLRDVMLVPEEAVLQRADGSVLYLLKGDRVERVRAETGRHRGGMVVVHAGVTPGSTVVVRGHTRLSDGQRVEIRNPDGSVVAPAVASKPAEEPGG